MSRESKAVQQTIREMMEREKVTYRDIAVRMDCSFQNVWTRLNDSENVSFRLLRQILNAFGHDFDLQPVGAGGPVDKDELFKSFEGTDMTYTSAAGAMKAMNYRLIII